MSTQVLVEVHEPGADAERLSALAGALRTELMTLEVEYVDQVRGKVTPSGARGTDAVEAGALLTSLTASVEIGRHLISTIQAWLRRGSDSVPRSVELTVGDCKLTVTGAVREQQDEVIAAFLSSLKRS